MSHYRDIFFAYHGPGPYPCFFECGTEWSVHVNRSQWHIHHIDENKQNNDPLNLAPACIGCHLRYHQLGDPAPRPMRSINTKSLDEQRAIFAEKTKVAWVTGKRKFATHDPGGWKSGARTHHNLYRCVTCGFESSPSGMGAHLKWKQHEGRVLIGKIPIVRRNVATGEAPPDTPLPAADVGV